jgi:aspartyl-tRNA synthetase
VFKLDDNERQSFDHLLCALKCGAPPHGGIALGVMSLLCPFHSAFLTKVYSGFDRLMSILCKTSTIRDVIAFPKSSHGTDLLFKTPAPVKSDVLKQYGIKKSREYGISE